MIVDLAIITVKAVLVVLMVLNLAARIVGRIFAPAKGH